jgi:hypothetical protein
MNGIASWDLGSALEYWREHPGKTLFVLFAGEGTKTAQAYVESLFPDVAMQFVTDTMKLEGDIAFAHLDDMPPQLAQALAVARCRGMQAEFNVVERSTGNNAFTVNVAAPFIDAAAIPGTLRNRVSQMEPPPARVTARFTGEINIATAGEYRFTMQVYPGSGVLNIDRKMVAAGQERGVQLSAGRHQVELQATLDPDPLTMVARLYWQGPDSGGQPEIVPFYRLIVPDPVCISSASTAAAVTPPTGNP